MVSLRSLQTEFLTMSFLSLLQVKGIFLRLARDLVVNASPLHSSYRDASHRKNGKIPARTIVVHTKKKKSTTKCRKRVHLPILMRLA